MFHENKEGNMNFKLLKTIIKQYLPKPLAIASIAIYRRIKFTIDAPKHKGNSVYCPCCDKHFSKFKKLVPNPERHNVDLLDITRLDAICPYCFSYPRHRIVCDYLNKNEHLLSSGLLVFAPLPAYQIWFKRHRINYVSTDLFDRFVDVKADIQQLPYANNEFGFISCDHVLEHVHDYAAALKELYRVVKIGGCVEITVPILPGLETTYEDETIVSPNDRTKAFGQNDHLRFFGNDFIGILRNAGFEVTVYDGNLCDDSIRAVSAPAIYDINKVFLCVKSND